MNLPVGLQIGPGFNVSTDARIHKYEVEDIRGAEIQSHLLSLSHYD